MTGPLIGLTCDPAEYTHWYPQLAGAAFARVFGAPGRGIPSWKTSAAMKLLPHDTIRHVSWKDPVPAAILREHLDAKPAGAPEWLTWHHEPENDGLDLSLWHNYWTTIRHVVDNHREAPNITLVAIHGLWPSRHRPGVDWREWMLPGLADVDGWDCYRDTTYDAYEPPESLLALPWQAAAEFGMRWSVPELGATRCTWDHDGTGRADWFQTVLAYAADHGADAVGLWCASDQTGKLDYRPTDPATVGVWRTMLASNQAARS